MAALKVSTRRPLLREAEADVAEVAGERRERALRAVLSGRGVIVARGLHRTYGTRDGFSVEVGAVKIFWDTRCPDGIWLEARGDLLRQLDAMYIGQLVRFAGVLSIRRKGASTWVSCRAFEVEDGAEPEAQREHELSAERRSSPSSVADSTVAAPPA